MLVKVSNLTVIVNTSRNIVVVINKGDWKVLLKSVNAKDATDATKQAIKAKINDIITIGDEVDIEYETDNIGAPIKDAKYRIPGDILTGVFNDVSISNDLIDAEDLVVRRIVVTETESQREQMTDEQKPRPLFTSVERKKMEDNNEEIVYEMPPIDLIADTIAKGYLPSEQLKQSKMRSGFSDRYRKFVIREQRIKNKENDTHDGLYTLSGFQFGSVYVTSPVTSIEVRDIKDATSLSTLRTKEPMTFRSSQAKASKIAIVTIQFPDEKRINAELRHIMAQLTAFPFTQIRNKDIARVMVPLNANMDLYYSYFPALITSYSGEANVVAEKKKTKDGIEYELHDIKRGRKWTDDEIEKKKKEAKAILYSRMPMMFNVSSVRISPVSNSPDAIDATFELLLMDLEPNTRRGHVLFLRNTYAALEQTAKMTNTVFANNLTPQRPPLARNVVEYGTPEIRMQSNINSVVSVIKKKEVESLGKVPSSVPQVRDYSLLPSQVNGVYLGKFYRPRAPGDAMFVTPEEIPKKEVELAYANTVRDLKTNEEGTRTGHDYYDSRLVAMASREGNDIVGYTFIYNGTRLIPIVPLKQGCGSIDDIYKGYFRGYNGKNIFKLPLLTAAHNGPIGECPPRPSQEERQQLTNSLSSCGNAGLLGGLIFGSSVDVEVKYKPIYKNKPSNAIKEKDIREIAHGAIWSLTDLHPYGQRSSDYPYGLGQPELCLYKLYRAYYGYERKPKKGIYTFYGKVLDFELGGREDKDKSNKGYLNNWWHSIVRGGAAYSVVDTEHKRKGIGVGCILNTEENIGRGTGPNDVKLLKTFDKTFNDGKTYRLYLFFDQKLGTLFPITTEIQHSPSKKKIYSLLPIYSKRHLQEIRKYISHYYTSDATEISELNSIQKEYTRKVLTSMLRMSATPTENEAKEYVQMYLYGQQWINSADRSYINELLRDFLFKGGGVDYLQRGKNFATLDGRESNDDKVDTSKMVAPSIYTNMREMLIPGAFLTDNIAQSKPFIKYYTSLLEEYVDPIGNSDYLEQHHDYLKYDEHMRFLQPYKQIRDFPLFRPYKTGISDDIVLTYRTMRSRAYYLNNLEAQAINVIRSLTRMVVGSIYGMVNNLVPKTAVGVVDALNSCKSEKEGNDGKFDGICADDSSELQNEFYKMFRTIFRKGRASANDIYNRIDPVRRSTEDPLKTIYFILKNIGTDEWMERQDGVNLKGRGRLLGSAPELSSYATYYHYAFYYMASALRGFVVDIGKLYQKIGDVTYDKHRMLAITDYLKYYYEQVKRASSGQPYDKKEEYMRRANKQLKTKKRERGDDEVEIGVWESRFDTDYETINEIRQILDMFIILSKAIEKDDGDVVEKQKRIMLLRDAIDDRRNSIYIMDDLAEKYNVPKITDNLLKGLNNIAKHMVDVLPTLYTPDVAEWKQMRINTQRFGPPTTIIDSYTVQSVNNSIPIFMDGHDNPHVVNLSGGVKKIMLSIVTDDIDIIEQVAEMAVDYNITMRQHSTLNMVNPLVLDGITHKYSVKNEVVSDTKSRIIMEKVLEQAGEGSGSISSTAIDTPVLIENNIANMFGVYGMVVDEITYNTVPDKTNVFIVSMKFTSVDPQQQDRETPRKQITTVDDSLIFADITSFVSGLWFKAMNAENRDGTSEGLVEVIKLISRGLEGVIANLVFLSLFSDKAELQSAFRRSIYTKVAGAMRESDIEFEDIYHGFLRPANKILAKTILKSIKDTKEETKKQMFKGISRIINDAVKQITTKPDKTVVLLRDIVDRRDAEEIQRHIIGGNPDASNIRKLWEKFFTIPSDPRKISMEKIHNFFGRNDELIYQTLAMMCSYSIYPKMVYTVADRVINSMINSEDSKVFGYAILSSLISHTLPYYLSGLRILKKLYDRVVYDIDIRERKLRGVDGQDDILDRLTRTKRYYKNMSEIIDKIFKRPREFATREWSKKDIENPAKITKESSRLTRAIFELFVRSDFYMNRIRKDFISKIIPHENPQGRLYKIRFSTLRMTVQYRSPGKFNDAYSIDPGGKVGQAATVRGETTGARSDEYYWNRVTTFGYLPVSPEQKLRRLKRLDKEIPMEDIYGTVKNQGAAKMYGKYGDIIGVGLSGGYDPTKEHIRNIPNDYNKYLLTTMKMSEMLDKYVTIPHLSMILTTQREGREARMMSLAMTMEDTWIDGLVKSLKEVPSLADFTKVYSDLTVCHLIRDMTENPHYSRMAFDRFNSYQDRPLPVLVPKHIKDNTGSAEKKALLELINYMTTPDFFVYKDPIVMTTEYGAMKSMVRAQQGVFATAEENISNGEWKEKNLEKEQRARLDDARKIIIPKVNEMAYQLKSSHSEIVYSSLEKKDKEAENIVKEYSDNVDDIVNKLETEPNKSISSELGKLKKSGGETLKELKNKVKDEKKNKTWTGNISLIRANSIDLASKSTNFTKLTSILNRLNKYSELDHLPSSVKIYLDDLFNPSAGAYTSESMRIMEQKLELSRIVNSKVTAPGTFGQSFPTYKLYIIEQDANEWLMFNDFYSYGSVSSIAVHKDKKSATHVATIQLTNVYGKLSDIIAARMYTENPFMVRPSDEENVNSFMLRPGAMIQIRMGFNGYLGPETIEFTGEIVEINGEEIMEIVAQGWGSQLTKPIGSGAGTDIGGGLIGGLINNTWKDLGMVASLLDLPEDGIHHLGGLSPFLGHLAGNRKYMQDHSRALKRVGLNVLSSLTQRIGGLSIDTIDSRMTNVYLTGGGGSWLLGRRRWLVYNETLWNALSDLVLQYPDYRVTTREFDEEGTLVMAKHSDIYQYTYEYNIFAALVGPLLSEIRNGITNQVAGFHTISKLLRKEGRDGTIADILVRTINSFFYSLPFKSTFSKLIKDANGEGNDDRTDEDEKRSITIGERLVDILSGKNTGHTIDSGSIEGKLRTLLDLSGEEYSNIYSKLSMDVEFEEETPTADYIDELNKQAAYILSHTIPKALETIMYEIGMTTPGYKPLSVVHFKTASRDIIRNNIKIQAGFNRVDMSYMYEDALGYLFGTMLHLDIVNDFLGSSAIMVENIDNPSNRMSLQISASPTLNPSRIRTYSTFQKNAAIKSTLSTPREYIVANAILGNLINDYYGGEIVLNLDPTIQVYDQVILYDDVNDMWGMVQVGKVTHMLSEETGAVTIIKPDMYTQTGINIDKATLGTMGKVMFGFRYFFSAAMLVLTSSLGSRFLSSAAKMVTNLGPFKRLSAVISKIKLQAILGKSGKTIDMFRRMDKASSVGFVRSMTSAVDDMILNNKGPQGLLKGLRKELTPVLKTIDDGLYSNVSIGKSIANIFDIDEGKYLNMFLKDGQATGLMTTILSSTTGKGGFASVIKNIVMGEYVSPFGKAWFGGSKPASGLAYWGNLMSRLLRIGLGYKVFRAAFLDPMQAGDSFVATAGEYFFMRDPITIVGLMKKGEPFVANLDGMRKADSVSGLTGLWQSLVTERFKYILEPLHETMGSVEMGLNEINSIGFTEISTLQLLR